MFDKSKYHQEYVKKNLKRVPLELSKEFYDQVKEHSSKQSETVNGFIKRAISETIQRDNSAGNIPTENTSKDK